MLNEHTAKAFDADLQELTRKVAEMGGLAEREVADAIEALAKRDTVLAKRVVAADPAIDALQQEIEEKAILTIARRQPMAVDLREVVGALRDRYEVVLVDSPPLGAVTVNGSAVKPSAAGVPPGPLTVIAPSDDTL